MSTHFILQISCIKIIFTNAFPVFFLNSRDGKNTPLVLLLSPKFWEDYPRFIKVFVVFFYETPLGYRQPFNETHRHLYQIYLTL
jgi:hypothetical protein